MPFDCMIEKDRIAVVTGSGKITGPEIIGQIEHLALHPEWKPGLATLWDLRNVVEMVVGRADLESYQDAVAGMRDRLGRGRVAIVAQRNHVKQMSLAFARVSPISDREIKVYQSAPEALGWLGLP